MRAYHGGRELPRDPRWRLRASPNPWDVQLAFDNAPVTRWTSARTLYPGMFVEVDFGALETVDAVALEYSRDQYKVRLKLEGQDAAGRWRLISDKPDEMDGPPLLGLRRAATAEIKARGIHYILVYGQDFAADDIRRNRQLWGLTLIGEAAEARLYRID